MGGEGGDGSYGRAEGGAVRLLWGGCCAGVAVVRLLWWGWGCCCSEAAMVELGLLRWRTAVL